MFSHEASPELYAYNTADRLIHLWVGPDFEVMPGATIEYVEQSEIDLQIPQSLDLVDFIVRGEPDGHYVIAAIVSDGLHDGDHRLILQYNRFDGTGAPIRIERAWSKGIPSDIERAESGTTGFIVTLSSAPYIIAVESAALPSLGDVQPEFSEIQYFETQLGATEIDGSTITYREKGIVEYDRPTLLD